MDKKILLASLRRKKRYASYHTWDHKPTLEGKVTQKVIDFLVSQDRIESNGRIDCGLDDPPHCVLTTRSGQRYYIEVSEIVHERSRRDAEQGKPVAVYEWPNLELSAAIQQRVRKKSHARIGYSQFWLILHTGEMALRSSDDLRERLDQWTCDCGDFDQVWLLGSYDPADGGVPIVELQPGLPATIWLIPR